MAGEAPVARLVNMPKRLLKILPEPVEVTPRPVITVLIAAADVALKPESLLLLITWPATVVEFSIPVIAEPAGVPVSATANSIPEAVERFEMILPETVVADAPDILIPKICALLPVEESVILLTRLLVMVDAELETIPE